MHCLIYMICLFFSLGLLMSCEKYEDKRLTVKVLEGNVHSPIEGIKVVLKKKKRKGIFNSKVLNEDSALTNSLGEVYIDVRNYNMNDVYYLINANPNQESIYFEYWIETLSIQEFDSIQTIYLWRD